MILLGRPAMARQLGSANLPLWIGFAQHACGQIFTACHTHRIPVFNYAESNIKNKIPRCTLTSIAWPRRVSRRGAFKALSTRADPDPLFIMHSFWCLVAFRQWTLFWVCVYTPRVVFCDVMVLCASLKYPVYCVNYQKFVSAKDACTHVFWLQILGQCSSLWAPFVTQLHFLCCVFGYLYCRWWTSSGDSFTHRYATKYECNDCMQFYRATHNIPEEDILASYSRVLLKMFLAEGIMCGHALFLASASEDPVEMIKVQIHIGFPLCPKKQMVCA